MYISSPPSSEVENFQMKSYYLAGERTPDLLNQGQTCYHLSQRGELNSKMYFRILFFSNIYGQQDALIYSGITPNKHY